MEKKSTMMTSMLDQLDVVEKQVLLSVSSMFRNVSHVAEIFLPAFFPLSPFSYNSNSTLEGNISEISDRFSRPNANLNATDSATEIPLPLVSPPCLDGGKSAQCEDFDFSSLFVEQVPQLYLSFLNEAAEWALLLVLIWLLNRATFRWKHMDFLPKFLGSWLFTFTILPGLAVGVSLLLILRAMLGLYLRVRFGGAVFLAHPMDSPWAYERPASPSTCTGLYVVRGKCDFNKVVARFAHCMDVELGGKMIFARLKFQIAQHLGFVCWRAVTDFDIRRHVKLLSHKNPALEGKALTEEQLFEELRRIHDEPLGEDNVAPWEVLVVPKFIAGKRGNNNGESDSCSSGESAHYAVVFRIHHSIMDGVSTGNALHTGIADKPFKFTVDPTEPLKISRFQYWTAHFLALCMTPYITIKNLSLCERNRFHGPVLTGKKNFTWTKPVRLETLKVMKNKTRTSVFSILMTCICGAMRNLFIRKKEPVPAVIHAAPPVAILPFPDRVLRNRFSIVIFPLPVGIRNMLKRLDGVYASAKNLSRSSDILSNFFSMHLLGLLPLFAIQFFGSFAHATITLSNIPGPAELVTVFEGDELVEVGAWVPVKNTIGIGMALFSYADRLRVTIIADEACVEHSSDVAFLRSEFQTQLLELAKEIGVDDAMFCTD